MVKYLVIGPGAMGMFGFFGILSRLKQLGQLDELEEISGASAGALIGFVFALAKGDTTKCLDFALSAQIGNGMKPSIKSLLTGFGLASDAKLRKLISSGIQQFMGKPDCTFKELWDWYPVKVHVSSYCVDAEKTVYFSVDSTPTMSVVDAVRASISVPFLIPPLKMNGWNYIDGGTCELVPGAPFLGKNRDDVFMVMMEWGISPPIKDLKSYAMVILMSQMRLRSTYDFPRLVFNPKESIFDFNMSQEAKLRLFLQGQFSL